MVQGGCPRLRSRPQGGRGPLSRRRRQRRLLPELLLLAVLAGVGWRLVPLICISVTTSGVERNCASADLGDGVCFDLCPGLSRVAVWLLLDSGEAFIY